MTVILARIMQSDGYVLSYQFVLIISCLFYSKGKSLDRFGACHNLSLHELSNIFIFPSDPIKCNTRVRNYFFYENIINLLNLIVDLWADVQNPLRNDK